jgi:CheY-like chemotaxis protein
MFDSKMVFLVVDDFDPMRKVTINQLRELGASTILSAANGLEAFRLLKNQRVDIVVSDWNMPVMSGLDLLKAMRAEPKLCHLPFVMITAEAEGTQVREAIANGVTNLLLKPYTPNRLAACINKAFSARPRPGSRPPAAPQAVPPVTVAPPPPQVAATTAGRLAGESDRPTLLIVDDTPDNLLLLSRMFKDDYRVRLAQNGTKALAMCHSDSPPDLVLLDVMMPDMDGFEVITKMREHPASENIPVIFVTAKTGDDARGQGLELGAVDYVTKPVDPATLKLRVRNFMRYVSVHKQLQANYDDMLEMAHLREDVEHITRHDLKGPLASVVGMVQSLIDQGAMTSQQTQQLRVVEETSLDVLNMVNLSSELLKIETGRFQLDAKPVDVTALLGRIVGALQTVYAAKHLAVSLHSTLPAGATALHALGDATLCYSLFNNLLKNACEAAPEGTPVTVTLTRSNALNIRIENTGVVPADIRERFFEKFVTSGKPGGTGLGTYSARLLAQAQQGDIALEVSDAEQRTTVTVTLPNH